MNPEPPLHPTSVPTRRKPIPRGRFRERVGLGCVLAYPYVTLRRLITCFGAPHVLHFRTDATVGSLACSWRCHLRHDREPCCGGANHYGSQRPELRLLLWLGAAPATGGLHGENYRDFRSKTRKDEARRTQRFSGLPHSADRGLCIEGHVPAVALKRFLNDKPSAIGLAVPGMPVGSPGMEGGSAEPYDVVMFGPAGRRTYMRFVGDRAL